MENAIALARRLARGAVWAGGALLFLAAFVTGIEVVLRKLFAVSLGGADEIAGFTMAIASAWAFPLALLDRAHIRVDSLYNQLPQRAAALLDILGLVCFAVFVSVLSFFGWGVFATSWRLNATSLSALEVPLWIPQGLWIGGLIFFLLVILLCLVRAVGLFIEGDLPALRRLAGSRTAVEETEEELAAAIRRAEVA